ncbi:MAG: hypothetical protein COA61_009630 [Zetaproteobacteria bacterium]|nr:hypothetical protein [Zetaproteobacteria bacterium]
MKITSKSHIASNQRIQPKKSSPNNFGSVFSSELQASDQQPAQQDTAEQASTNQQAYPLVEQASKLLSQVLTQLEGDAQPNQETLHALLEIRQQLDQLTAQDHESKVLSQAKTLLAVEAQRIQTMKQ